MDLTLRRASSEEARVPAFSSPRALSMLAGVLLVTFLAYLKSLTDGFVRDDRNLIVGNRFLDQRSFLWNAMTRPWAWWLDPARQGISSYYRPVVADWVWVGHRLFGQNPMGWHATMLVLHLAATALVFVVVRRLTEDRFVAPAAALLFGLLPAQAEAVIWASAIPYPLTAILELAAFYLFVCRAGVERRNWMLALMLYAVALLSYEAVVVFPALIASYVFLLESQSEVSTARRLSRASACAAPFAAEVLAYFVLRRAILGFVLHAATTVANPATLAQSLMTIPAALATYLTILVDPWAAAPFHRVFIVKSPASAEFYLPAAGLIALAAVFWLLVRDHPRRRLYLFCAAWMAITIAPVMDLRAFKTGELVHDRYLYMPSVGWCLLLAEGAVLLARRSIAIRRAAVAAAVVISLAYGTALWHLQSLWHNDISYFTSWVHTLPDATEPRVYLGYALLAAGDVNDAQRQCQTALSIDPGSGSALVCLGQIHARLRNFKQAATEISEGLKRTPAQESADIYITLARLYDLGGDPARSEAALKRAESLPGGMPEGALVGANLKIQHGDAAGAEKTARQLTERFPADPRVWTMLGMARTVENRNEPALAAYQRALEFVPNDTTINFLAALVLHRLGRDPEALTHCRRVLAIVPNDPNARALMAQIERADSR